MNNQYWSDCLYQLFLSSLQSCTFASLTDGELRHELDNLIKRAIARFKFPKVSLEYAWDDELDDDNLPKGYYFINEVGMKEILVLLAWAKVYWVEYQLSREENYENVYADKDVKTFSSGNLLTSIKNAMESLTLFARKTEEEYSRVNIEGKPAIGDINV